MASAQSVITEAAIGTLQAAIWAQMDTSDPFAIRDALLVTTPAVIDTYGAASAAASAEWYEYLRDQQGLTSPHTTLAADTIPHEAILARTRFGARHLWGDDPDATRRFIENMVADYVAQPGRDTIVQNTASDVSHPGWARVPTGRETCAFCLMLASRGAMYDSEKSARYKRSGGRYHGRCDCVATPVWSESDYPAGYDPDALFDQYQAAADQASGYSTRAILSELRQQQHSH